MKQWTLFASIVVWAFLASMVFVLLCRVLFRRWLWQGIDFTYSTTPLDVVKVALTMLGGIGAVGYLVIKYQERQAAKREEQRDVEKAGREDEQMSFTREDRVKTTFSDGIRMLGDDKPSTRTAGVYALIEFADNQRGRYPQRVIDILCGYLRANRDDDGPVESTVLGIMRNRLSPCYGEDLFWHDIDVDLHDATLTEQFLFGGIKVRRFNASGATFKSQTFFNSAVFEGAASFSSATLPDRTSFENATFKKEASFEKAQFGERTSFYSARFNKRAIFDQAQFGSNANFNGAVVWSISFIRTFFDYALMFENIRFTERTSFMYTQFTQPVSLKNSTCQGSPLDEKSLLFKHARFNEIEDRKNPPTD
ncbi:MAG: pentapeptide repeat-containing protein [Bifidobacterium sp.]